MAPKRKMQIEAVPKKCFWGIHGRHPSPHPLERGALSLTHALPHSLPHSSGVVAEELLHICSCELLAHSALYHRLFLPLKCEHAFFNSAARDEPNNTNLSLLPHTMNSVHSLQVRAHSIEAEGYMNWIRNGEGAPDLLLHRSTTDL